MLLVYFICLFTLIFTFSSYQFQLIEMLVQQIALDQTTYPEDMSSACEFSVKSLIPKFSAEQETQRQDSYPPLSSTSTFTRKLTFFEILFCIALNRIANFVTL
jgi:hypothetical protein